MRENPKKEDAPLLEALEGHARGAYEEYKEYAGGAVAPPTFHLGFRCPGCGKIWWLDFLPPGPRELPEAVSKIWAEVNGRGCPGCGRRSLELFGYVCTYTANAYDLRGTPPEVRGSLSPEELLGLPRSRIYFALCAARSGTVAVGTARIEDTVGELEFRRIDRGKIRGPLIPLSGLRPSEDSMYG